MSITKELIKIPMTTLPFYTYQDKGIRYIEFDARECNPPEPMVNAIRALQFIQNTTTVLVGTFFHEPFPLYEQISSHFQYYTKELPCGDFEVRFKLKIS